MTEEVRMRRLGLALKVISIAFLAYIPVAILIILDSPLLADGSFPAALLRWRPFNKAYFMMMVSIYTVWAIMLWRASENPIEHRSLIDFTIWANAAHGAVMLVLAIVQEGELLHLASDVPLLALMVGVLFWLRPRPPLSS